MSNDDSAQTTQNPPSPKARRPSFTELFASRPPTQRPQPSAMSVAISQQAQEATRTRRLSTSTLGLSGSPTHGQASTPFGNLRRGTGSVSEGSGPPSAVDESAVDESATLPPIGENASAGKPASPNRRMSFGARAAYGVARSASLSYPNGSGSSGGNTGQAAGSAPGVGGKKDGFDIGETLRTRAERASISGQTGGSIGTVFGHNRTRSQVTENTAPSPQPPPAVQKTPTKQNVPDHFQERILKGDFYMD